MCMSKPSIPAPTPPPVIAPEQEKKLELNPKAKTSQSKKAKKAGTRSLQIPMGGIGGGASGLNIPS